MMKFDKQTATQLRSEFIMQARAVIFYFAETFKSLFMQLLLLP
jgi:hypothetical protein